MRKNTLIVAVAACGFILTSVVPSLAAGPMNDKERMRAEAEHNCFDDVQKLCSDATSDEEKVKSCMKAHHAQLSLKCAKAFDAGQRK